MKSRKTPPWYDHIDAMIKDMESGGTITNVISRYSQHGSHDPRVRRILERRWLMWRNFHCRPPVGRAGDNVPDDAPFPPPGWTVPRDHPGFDPATMIPIDLPVWQADESEVDFSCD